LDLFISTLTFGGKLMGPPNVGVAAKTNPMAKAKSNFLGYMGVGPAPYFRLILPTTPN
jgi:hypothetical protein